jgi:hypothetical protein
MTRFPHQRGALLTRCAVFPLIAWALLSLISSLGLGTARAQESTESSPTPPKLRFIEVVVQSPFEAERAVGVLFSERGTQQRPVEKPRRIDESFVVVRVPYEDQLPRDTMVTAVLYGPEGRTAIGNVRPVFGRDPRESFLSIPDCVPAPLPNAPLQTQLSMIESLVQLRSQRRGLAQVKVAQQLSDSMVQQLQKLERGFGLRYESPLSADLPPVELIDRLHRVLTAIRLVRGSSPSSAPSRGSSPRPQPGRR